LVVLSISLGDSSKFLDKDAEEVPVGCWSELELGFSVFFLLSLHLHHKRLWLWTEYQVLRCGKPFSAKHLIYPWLWWPDNWTFDLARGGSKTNSLRQCRVAEEEFRTVQDMLVMRSDPYLLARNFF
jgi:hypothetical protein